MNNSKALATTLAAITLLAGSMLVGCEGESAPADSGGSATATGSGSGSGSGSSGGGDDTSGAGGSASSSGSGGSSSGSGGASFSGFTQVDDGGNAVAGSTHAAIAPDGSVYVTWTEEGAGNRDVYVSRSTDGGTSFEAPVLLDDNIIEPIISNARHPWMTADNDRVAVAFNDSAGTVHLYIASTLGTLDFDQYFVVGADVATNFRDFAKPIIMSDGSIAVAFHGYPQSGARIFLAREGNSYNSEVASGGAPGLPCECCPLEAVVDAEGDVMLAFRNNDDNTREFWLAQAPSSGAFSDWAAASNTEGIVNNCPMQGPRLEQLGGNDHAMVYSTRGSNSTGSVAISFSSDDGASWSGGVPIPAFTGDEPTIALGGSGRIYVTAVTGNSSSAMLWSDDDGSSWSAAEPIRAADGDIATPQAEGAQGMAILSGVSSANTVWFLRME
jgi:hypothetical protein